MNIELIYKLFTESSGITTDSRNVKPGAIYLALRGDRFDGNAFTSQALENGASYAIIDNKDYFIDNRTIIIENTLVILQKLANYHRCKLGIPIIAITGTNGKTTTKELVRSVLSQQFEVFATQGNLNNHIGVPITLLSMTSSTQIGIVEMGANHPNEIKQLCEIADPYYGLITNIGKAHLEGFGGFQGVINTKKELYDYVIARGRTIFYNSDNKILSQLLNDAGGQLFSYGLKSGKYCKGKIIEANPYLEIEVKALTKKRAPKISVKSQIVGDYNAENLLAAVCIGLYFNVPLHKIQTAIEGYIPSNNRSQLKITERNHLLLDYYNANPSSTEAAITNFLRLNYQNKVIILGDMLELGQEAEIEHNRILKMLINLKGIEVLLVGKYYKTIAKPYGFKAFANAEELKTWLGENPLKKRFILIKGSRGIQLEKITDQL
jgi:UDP-N-acetylmuramoyl-tripeptide--D-alanyl-D-alanine ligase